MSKTIAVGVIGTGGMGGRHAINLAQRINGAQVAAVMDIDQERASKIAAACGGAKVFDDARELIADEDVEAIVITSPDPTHAELTLACLEAGKSVLCEKPLATTLADAEAYQKEVILKADNALAQKLDAEIEIQKLWAEAFAKRQVPTNVFGAGSGSGTPVGSDSETKAFMQMLTLDAAKRLNYTRQVTENK